MNKIKEFNYKHIYFSNRVKPAMKYFELVINEIYDTLKSCYSTGITMFNIKKLERFYPKLSNGFYNYLENYSDFSNRENLKLKNKVIFDVNDFNSYCESIIYYISGMTDNFAIEIYNEIIGF